MIAKEFFNFLTKKETEDILSFARNTDLWSRIPESFWDGRVVGAHSIYLKNPELGKTLDIIKHRIVDTVQDSYQLDQKLYPDLLNITRWFPGMEQSPHSDNMENTNDHQIHRHREYGIVIYLNDDFSGGKTFYPQYNFEIAPEPGKMAVHPASTDHMHGVTKIENAVRYTLTSFLTFDKTKELSNFIV
jgi:hypothetical protein